jgi:hypothetical protein
MAKRSVKAPEQQKKETAAEALGKAAFARGADATPAHDKELMKLLKGMPVSGGGVDIISAWARGWHTANAEGARKAVEKIDPKFKRNSEAATIKGHGSREFKAAKAELAKLGIDLRANVEWNEYQVKYRDDKNPKHGYHTDDLEDAVATGKKMAEHKHKHNSTSSANTEIYDPIFNSTAKQFTTTAADNPHYPPKSPMSGEPMEIINCGAHGQTPFRAWIHIRDRIVLPYRES